MPLDSQQSEKPNNAIPIRVAIVDDDRILLKGIASHLSPARGFAEPLLFTDSKNAFKKLAVCPVDIALVDLVIPGDCGIRIIRKLAEKARAKYVLAHSTSTDPRMMWEALQAGAIGHLNKSDDFFALESALRRALRGEPVISAESYQMLLSQIQGASRPSKFHALSPAETMVLALAAEGLCCSEIAKRLQVSINTVYVHNKRILKKLEVPDRLAAVARYQQELGMRSSCAAASGDSC